MRVARCCKLAILESAAGGGLWKKVLLKISQISQENTWAGTSFLRTLVLNLKNICEGLYLLFLVELKNKG